jgi:hypothetical protein
LMSGMNTINIRWSYSLNFTTYGLLLPSLPVSWEGDFRDFLERYYVSTNYKLFFLTTCSYPLL